MIAVKADLWVVMPTYNEAGALAEVLREWAGELRGRVPGFKLLVVDDGSTDSTAAELEALRGELAELRVLRQANGGHGQACLAGYREALSQGAEWILQVDSDGQCDPADFEAVWDAREGVDAVLGRRCRRQDGFGRTVISRLLSLAVFARAGAWLPDPNVPFRLIRAKALEACLPRLPTKMELANVGVSLALASGTEVAWEPISFRARRLRLPKRRFAFYVAKGRRLWAELGKIQGLGDSRAALAYLGALAGAIALSAWMVPRLLGGLWWDTGFFGFVGPIAQRMSPSTPLYGDGLRVPIAPLSFALAKLYDGDWRVDHAVILALKLAQVSVLFFGLRRRLGGWASCVAGVGTLALSLASKKLLLYDALSEFWVAASIALIFGRTRVSPKRWLLIGALAALALGTKQTTGLGIALIGALGAWQARELRSWSAGAAVTAVAGLLALAPLVSIPGFFEQVWLTGSLPKGGPSILLKYPLYYARDLLLLFAGPFPELIGWPAVRFSWLAHWPAAIAFTGGAWLAARGRHRGLWLSVLLIAGLHSLSVPFFRWADENYTLFFSGVALIAGGQKLRARAWPLAVASMLLLGAGYKLVASFSAHADATVRRSEVKELQRVWLRPRTDSLFELIARVRELAGPQGTVLWLPSDANVDAWLERPRPRLHTASAFPDLYWDRWVEEDLRVLQAEPPRVIVIGPLEYWQRFSRLWHPEQPLWGAEHLVERLRHEVLPARYRAAGKAEVTFGNGSEREDRAEFELFVLQGPG